MKGKSDREQQPAENRYDADFRVNVMAEQFLKESYRAGALEEEVKKLRKRIQWLEDSNSNKEQIIQFFLLKRN